MEHSRRPAAVMIPLIETEEGTEIIFEVRAEGISQAKDICFPGGGIDEDETPEEAAVRETCEELLIDEDCIGMTYDLFQLIGPGGRVVHAFAGELEGMTGDYGAISGKRDAEFTFNKAEISEVFRMPLDYFVNNHPKELEVSYEMSDADKAIILELTHRDEYNFKPRMVKLYFYDTPYGVIWGLTAEIIYRYVNMQIL